jgi:hypothetical protein
MFHVHRNQSFYNAWHGRLLARLKHFVAIGVGYLELCAVLSGIITAVISIARLAALRSTRYRNETKKLSLLLTR